MSNETKKMRVWWIPQVPGTRFFVKVSSVEEGVKVMNILAEYDLFQLKNNIKPDYCNVGGIEVFEDIGDGKKWISWYDDETGEDDPVEFLRSKQTS